MQLTQYTDYALRTLIYLARQQNQLVTISAIAEFYAISRNHLIKIVHHLAQQGYIETIRGKHGGIRLAKAPEEIRLGELVRQTEPNFNLAECFDKAKNHCAITRSCRLQGILHEAARNFIATLDRHTLADVVGTTDNAVAILGNTLTRRDNQI